MTDFEHEREVPATEFGTWLAEQTRARQQANADMMNEMLSGAGRAGHADTSRQLRSAHTGLFGHATPQELGQAVAERQATVGSAWGHERPLERNGGLYDHHVTAPHPAQRDLRYVNQVAPPAADAVSPLKAYMDGR